ncbi:hypothetical protein QEH59_11545 [Coraliomargarita sp. SDUM461004]|uniref:Uncharacterized protein n=1 Tax=Thalassobacterium sedimentorum TaxID=3041258 RepID=A0ABU1AJR8_9BACT|nr:hypothetical protein [Coraliomargarita sp. SDUM461004]MDQ8195062.1 hypothetical protein [Coraliomargarita sp. SDUM461004]
MTAEEKDLINQMRIEDADLKRREKVLQRLGEILEETFILDLLPDKAVMQALEKMAVSRTTPTSLKRKAKSLVKAYKI